MKTVFPSLLAALGVLLAPPPARAALQVVATLPDYAALAREIGGDKVKVTSLARGTEDPHFVDAKPSFLRVLHQADALVESGAELEIGWLPPLVQNARNPKILGDAPGHIVLARGLRLRDVPAGPVDRAQGDIHAAGNPHFTLDPENGGPLARTLAEAFARLDPAHAAHYRGNLEKFNARLEAKLAEWGRLMQPLRGVKVITYHKSYDYLLARYGLELAGTIEPKPGIEPSATHIRALVAQARQAGVRLVLAEPGRSRKTPAYVAESAGAKLVVLPILAGGHEQAADYFAYFDHTLAQLAGALNP